jgi:hypothetical protein
MLLDPKFGLIGQKLSSVSEIRFQNSSISSQSQPAVNHLTQKMGGDGGWVDGEMGIWGKKLTADG